MRLANAEPSSSTVYDNDDWSPWDSETLSLAGSKTISIGDSSTFAYKKSSKRASTTSFMTVGSTSTVGTIRRSDQLVTRRSSVFEIIFKSLTFVTMLPRISSARNELAAMRRASVPSPPFQQVKVLNDLLELTRDELPHQMRKTALRLIQYSLGNVIQDIFTAATRQQFLKTLGELCSEELPYSVRKDGLIHFNYLIGAGAGLPSKSFVLEYDNCRDILNVLKATSFVSVKLAACAYLWLSWKRFQNDVYSPISEKELTTICINLVDLTQAPLPIDTRRDALDWLWRFESTQSSELSEDDKRLVGASILEISGYTDSNGLLLYHHADSENDCLSGLRCLWWFVTLPSWAGDLWCDSAKRRKVGADLLSITCASRSHEIQQQGFELIALFSNLVQWRDMYDETTWRTVSYKFAQFCLTDSEQVNKDEIMRRVESLLVRSTSTESDESGKEAALKDLHVAKRMSRVPRYNQATVANKAVRQYLGPQAGTTVEAALDNLALFVLPGESLLIQKDQQVILYDRICDYARFNQTRLIAVQAMYALLTIQEWLSRITFAKGPPKARD